MSIDLSRMKWYVDHRIEFLQNRQETLKQIIGGGSADSFDYEALREFLENKGKIDELRNLVEHTKQW